jgi:conjugal transfer pilus assembly protein TraF
VLAISEFGETNHHFARSVKDNGLAETWGVSVYPSLFAVNPKTGNVIPIANGMISIEEMEERILTITKEHES